MTKRAGVSKRAGVTMVGGMPHTREQRKEREARVRAGLRAWFGDGATKPETDTADDDDSSDT